RHDRLRAVVEEGEQLVDETAMGRLARDRGLEDVRVADLLRPPDRAFGFQPVDDGLHRRVRGAAPRREGLLDFANGKASGVPEGFENTELEAAQPWFACHQPSLVCV